MPPASCSQRGTASNQVKVILLEMPGDIGYSLKNTIHSFPLNLLCVKFSTLFFLVFYKFC